jgi:hypothetical protein
VSPPAARQNQGGRASRGRPRKAHDTSPATARRPRPLPRPHLRSCLPARSLRSRCLRRRRATCGTQRAGRAQRAGLTLLPSMASAVARYKNRPRRGPRAPLRGEGGHRRRHRGNRCSPWAPQAVRVHAPALRLRGSSSAYPIPDSQPLLPGQLCACAGFPAPIPTRDYPPRPASHHQRSLPAAIPTPNYPTPSRIPQLGPLCACASLPAAIPHPTTTPPVSLGPLCACAVFTQLAGRSAPARDSQPPSHTRLPSPPVPTYRRPLCACAESSRADSPPTTQVPRGPHCACAGHSRADSGW